MTELCSYFLVESQKDTMHYKSTPQCVHNCWCKKNRAPSKSKANTGVVQSKANCIAVVAHKTSLERKQKISGAQSLGLN